MAVAGMGDVLTGIIAGLLAQGLDQISAARIGVLIHARAGDEASRVGERGMIASDLFPYAIYTTSTASDLFPWIRHHVNP